MWLLLVLGVVVLLGFTAFTGAPYVPSKRSDLARAFDELYLLKEDDVLVDIGSGDGIVLRTAAKKGAKKAIGFEIHPLLVLLSLWLARRDKRVITKLANFWRADLPRDTSVVYVFGDDRDMSRMVKYIEKQATKLDRPLWLISYGFDAKNHKATKTVGAHHLYKINPLHK